MIIKYNEFVNENIDDSLKTALLEIQRKSTSTYRHTGLIFGELGMGEIFILKNSLYIGSLISFKKHGGIKILQMIIDIANKYKLLITLLAQVYDKYSDFNYTKLNIKDERTPLSQKELINWYKSLGFNITKKLQNSVEMEKKPEIKYDN